MNFPFRQIVLLLSMPLLLASLSALAQPANAERDVLYWYDPMYPQQRFDKPGPSPFMDMDLVPRFAEQDADSEGRAVMRISPGIMQNLGMRLATVSREPVRISIEATGQITFNQRDLAVVQARSGGFVERVYALAPQDLIEQGAPIADLLVPEWAAVQEEYLALRSLNEPALIAAALQRMRLAGMPDALIRQLEREGRAQRFWTLRSPIDGVLKSLDVREGMTLSTGSTLAQINGLKTVWLLIEVPEAQIASLEAGQKIQARLPALPGETLEGTIETLLPEASRDSRTVQVRVVLDNAQQLLRPGMTAEVSLDRQEADALVVPTEALIRTGRRTLVMVAEEEGRFRPVEVRIGRETETKTVVLDGLEEGQQVVASGQFLLDSEASLRGLTDRPAQPMSEPAAVLHESEGTIVGLDGDMIFLDHGPFETLNMPGMTMGFPLSDPSLIEGLEENDRVRVGVRESDDGLTIDRIEKLGGQP